MLKWIKTGRFQSLNRESGLWMNASCCIRCHEVHTPLRPNARRVSTSLRCPKNMSLTGSISYYRGESGAVQCDVSGSGEQQKHQRPEVVSGYSGKHHKHQRPGIAFTGYPTLIIVFLFRGAIYAQPNIN